MATWGTGWERAGNGLGMSHESGVLTRHDPNAKSVYKWLLSTLVHDTCSYALASMHLDQAITCVAVYAYRYRR